MEIIETMRQLAQEEAEKISYKKRNTAMGTLRRICWPNPPRKPEQRDVAQWNAFLNPWGYLGRLAVSATIIQKEFPAAVLRFGEVIEDFWADLLLERLIQEPEMAKNKRFLKELLMQEEPHAILLINGVQFDPLTSVLGGDRIIHPKIERFPFWEAVATVALNSMAWLDGEPRKKMNALERAQSVCQSITLTVENMIEPLFLLGEKNKAIAKGIEAVEHRPTAKNFYTMFLLTNDDSWIKEALKKYPQEIIDAVAQEFQ